MKVRHKFGRPAALLLFCGATLAVCGATARAQGVPVTARVEVTAAGNARKAPDASNVVVWLVPLGGRAALPAGAGGEHQPPRLTQKHKSFDPHLLVVPVGSVVQFPNQDPFFHNVFSLFEGKRFDLGLYEAGSTRSVRFDRAGVSYLFCNIHPEMSAVVVAVETPYYALSDRSGQVTIAGVPPGRYRLHVWSERAMADSLESLRRVVVVSASERSLGVIHVVETPAVQFAHKNKYGQDYEPPAPDNPAYPQP